jgi:hypothetical protein
MELAAVALMGGTLMTYDWLRERDDGGFYQRY